MTMRFWFHLFAGRMDEEAALDGWTRVDGARGDDDEASRLNVFLPVQIRAFHRAPRLVDARASRRIQISFGSSARRQPSRRPAAFSKRRRRFRRARPREGAKRDEIARTRRLTRECVVNHRETLPSRRRRRRMDGWTDGWKDGWMVCRTLSSVLLSILPSLIFRRFPNRQYCVHRPFVRLSESAETVGCLSRVISTFFPVLELKLSRMIKVTVRRRRTLPSRIPSVSLAPLRRTRLR